jgi:AcrR family transcriptional regulator
MADRKVLKKGQRSYHHGDLRGALLEAIRQLIERDGADGFSIAEACRIAGVSTAAPYKHFRDRGEMLHGVVLAAMGRLRERMRRAADAHPAGSNARIADLGRAYVDFAREEPGIFRVMFGLSADHGQDAELTREGEATGAIVDCVVAEHLGLDPACDEVRLRSYALWCFVHGHSFLTLDGKRDAHQFDVPEDALLHLIGEAMLPAERAAPRGRG